MPLGPEGWRKQANSEMPGLLRFDKVHEEVRETTKFHDTYKVVAVPLDTDPPILGGMRIQDLIWPAAAVGLDIVIWHQKDWSVSAVYTLCAVILIAGFVLAAVRIESRTLPQWAGIIVGFIFRPRRYLP